MVNPAEKLTCYIDSLLNKRIVNVLSIMGLTTIDQFAKHFWVQFSWKIEGLRWVWSKSSSKLYVFIKYLEAEGFGFYDENPSDIDILLSEDTRRMKLIAYSSILSRRTNNALMKCWIQVVNDLYLNADRISPNLMAWLGKKWFDEICKLKKFLSESTTDKILNTQVEISDFFTDKKISGILTYNLITRMDQLSEYVNWQKNWSDLRYLNDEDIPFLTETYRKYSFTPKSNKGTLADLFITNFSDPDKLIINKRILWDATLEELWEEMNLTRERIRQKQKEIEERIAKLWCSIIENDRAIFSKILQIVDDYNFVLLPKDIRVFDFLWFQQEDSAMIFLILRGLTWISWNFLEKSNKVCVLNSSCILLNWADLRDIYEFILQRLERNNDDISIDDLAYEFILNAKKPSLPNNLPILSKKKDIALFIARIAEIHKDYVLEWGILHRFNKKLKTAYYIENILKDNPDWLHFREITKRINTQYWINIDERKVHANLTKTDSFNKFINIGLWLYTIKWSGQFSGEKTTDIIYSFLKEFNSPKTIQEITEFVLQRKKIEEGTVRVAISYSTEFRFCFYNTWKVGLKEWGLWNERIKKKKNTITQRNSIANAVEALINDGVLRRGESYTLLTLKELISGKFHTTVDAGARNLPIVLSELASEWIFTIRKQRKNIYLLN